ncbi:MAG: hypothetical protein KIT02_00005 [Devosia sp.]|uniref:helix-turn-helix domain-containing protein n=1 Tax=Devosia sp. TaxID=1871048 RepID=UPI0024CDB3ED|nr:helix-turn-helix domain-containing protein [Devosia sp.]UYN99671.1 MAG: hypothetical protein KIT02_00005 [Devosia sp.]
MTKQASSCRRATLDPAGPARSIDEIIRLVAREQHVPKALIKHRSRCRAGVARARQISMYLCHVIRQHSLADIGRIFDRDRTTVSYACAVIEDLRDDPRIDAEISRLEAMLEVSDAARV